MKYLVTAVLAFSFTACAPQETSHDSASQVETAAIEQSDVRNIRAVAPGLFAGGQPSEAQIQFLAANGVKHVVNLRPDSEQSFDEASVVSDAGMTYHQLAIAGGADISIENAIALRTILADNQGEATLVHCASGNRVGALMAIGAHVIDGESIEQSLEIGRSWGLTRLESRVIEVINEYDAVNTP